MYSRWEREVRVEIILDWRGERSVGRERTWTKGPPLGGSERSEGGREMLDKALSVASLQLSILTLAP